MSEYIKAWECIGCGRLEAQQTCLGVCEDRPVQLVYASAYEDMAAKNRVLEGRVAQLEALARALVGTVPRAGQWEASFLALQKQGRRVLQTPPALQEAVAAGDRARHDG